MPVRIGVFCRADTNFHKRQSDLTSMTKKQENQKKPIEPESDFISQVPAQRINGLTGDSIFHSSAPDFNPSKIISSYPSKA